MNQSYEREKNQSFMSDLSSLEKMEWAVKELEEGLICKDAIKMKSSLSELHEHTQDLSSPHYMKFILSPFLREMCRFLEKENASKVKRMIICFYGADKSSAMMEIIDQSCKEAIVLFERQKGFVHKEIDSVIQYILCHYQQDISVDQLAEVVCRTPSYLSSIFKKETGENLARYIRQVRMEKARELLDESYEKIVDIAREVGYQNVSYFCQIFRETYGISPKRYRTRCVKLVNMREMDEDIEI